MITLIAAADTNNALGYEGKLLWHLPLDFQRFKNLTTGHCIIMGRKTFESLPKMLPNRTHIIITRQPNYKAENCIIAHSVEEAIAIAQKTDQSPFIIGGGEIYALALPFSDRIELTRVHTAVSEADAFFPEISAKIWKLTFKEDMKKDEKHAYDFSFETYERFSS